MATSYLITRFPDFWKSVIKKLIISESNITYLLTYVALQPIFGLRPVQEDLSMTACLEHSAIYRIQKEKIKAIINDTVLEMTTSYNTNFTK
jgi:hypothetical protein